MTPSVNNERLYFEASGLYDGLVLLGDTKTRSYWNHITGECLHGHYAGEVLEVNNLFHYTFKMAIEDFPDIRIAVSKPPFPYNMAIRMFGKKLHNSKGFIPPFFRKTMTTKDDRLDENEIGLGVVIDGQAKYYNIDKIADAELLRDHFAGKDLLIRFDNGSRVPRCTVKGSDEIPIQFYTRWYGFSYTYKNCEIYKER